MISDQTYLVTGGAGFIGSNFVRLAVKQNIRVINLDKLTYSGNLQNLKECSQNENYQFIKGDIVDKELVTQLLTEYKPNWIIHFAAESHVDRSILDPGSFLQTNITGTFQLLHSALEYWKQLDAIQKTNFKFLHVSTDEVYGSLSMSEPPFSEHSCYLPNSPYAASKAASDHLVRAYNKTFGFPTITTHCSNNYGPYQFPEKLIPLMILNALDGKDLPIYGDGSNVRDWIHVQDHCEAIEQVMLKGQLGEVYNIGGECEISNKEVVHTLCSILDKYYPRSDGKSYTMQIRFVNDRLGHDKRYAISNDKINKQINWYPKMNFSTGLVETIKWYVENKKWVESIKTGEYAQWIETNYSDRNKK